MFEDKEKIWNKERWETEAQAIINDVKSHVLDIRVSQKLQSTDTFIYINLITLEGLKYCVKVSAEGFTIVANEHDTVTNTVGNVFETPYSLLEFVSPKYRESFGNQLMKKLQELSDS